MIIFNIFVLAILLYGVSSVELQKKFEFDKEDHKTSALAEIVISNLKSNGWNNIIFFGKFSNELYTKLNVIPFTFVTSNTNEEDYYVEDAVPYHSDTILMNCNDFANFEESLLQLMNLPYWHPHSNLYLIYHGPETKEDLARIFFIFWYYRAPNVIMMQFRENSLFITQYTTYNTNTELGKLYGCWTVKKIGMPIYSFVDSFVCVEGCLNVTLHSKLRETSLGSCVTLITTEIDYSNRQSLDRQELFGDKGKNFHGFTFRTFVSEVLPFMSITEHKNNSYSLGSRDGIIWETMSNLLNFSFDLTPSVNVMKKPFDFELTIQQIFAVAHRKGDLFLTPIYQFDVIVVEIDYTFPYKDSGVCFMAHRANFETILFDMKTLLANYEIIIQSNISFICIWFIFCLYSGTETRQINMDFIGKNFMNSVRSILLINLYHPPKRTSFRLFLTIIIWSFFIINFSTQATIISFFTASKRGREVNTFDDIVEKGYTIEGMASPDVVLPDTDVRFRKINSKLSPIRDRMACVKELSNDSHRFCLIDCSVGHYFQKNMWNEKGEQYLHIAKDRVHSHYLNFVFPKHSVISDHFNKYIMTFFEAGLVQKWEENRLNEVKEEAPTKPLSMNDMVGIFNMYAALVITTIVIFFIELYVGKKSSIEYSKTVCRSTV